MVERKKHWPDILRDLLVEGFSRNWVWIFALRVEYWSELPFPSPGALTQSLYYNKVLNISCNLLSTVLKVENRLVMSWSFTLVILWLTWSCPVSQQSIFLHIISHGKDQNLKFKVQFLLNVYSFQTIISLTTVSQKLSI